MKRFVLQTMCMLCSVFTACLIANPITLPLNKETDSCSPYEYTCKDGKCISQYDVCNGYNDCYDGGDENITICLAKPCLPDYPFRCLNNGVCIPLSWMCDGDNDCGDNSDEVRLTCSKLMPSGSAVSIDYSNPNELEPVDEEFKW